MIVLTHHGFRRNEHGLLNTLMDEGLELLHIRKPFYSKEQVQDLIEHIHPQHRSKLVLHTHHELAKDRGIHRIHFAEKERFAIKKSACGVGLICSTSVHNMHRFNSLSSEWSYAFISPVFDSISKTEYPADQHLWDAPLQRSQFQVQLIGLGGIQASNIRSVIRRGFDDAALLGAIWETGDPIKNFIKCRSAIALSY